MHQAVFVSATPADYELEKTDGIVVEQIIRPTGLLDPVIEVRPSQNQIDDLLNEIDDRVKKEERVLVTTLTKRMAEDLTEHYSDLGLRVRYLHSDVDTVEREPGSPRRPDHARADDGGVALHRLSRAS